VRLAGKMTSVGMMMRVGMMRAGIPDERHLPAWHIIPASKR
jgi:hypothetical protein